MLKNRILAVLAASLLFISPVFAAEPAVQKATDTAPVVTDSNDRNNPIEKAFAKDFETAEATSEINYVNEAYLNAWQDELKNVSDKIKKGYTVAADVKRVDAYLAAYENLTKIAFDLEMLNWISDPAEPVAKRSFGTGGPGAGMLAQAKLYKQATLNLIAHIEAMNPDVKYAFSYKGKGAELEKVRKQNSD